MNQHSQESVLVVGAGPVGFVAALRLAQSGVPVTLVEKEETLQDDLRASTFHPPTLEMLDGLALTAPLLNEGLRTDKWQIRLHETHEKAEFDLAAIRADTRYPFRLQVEQRVLCRLAAERVGQEPLVDLRMQTELLDFEQHDERVTARLRGPDGEAYDLETPLLIAADGSKSRVRDRLALPFEGLTYPETTILITTAFPFDLAAIRADTRYPFRLQVEQRVLCRLAAARVDQEPLVDLRMQTELLDFEQHGERVTARLRGPDGEAYELETPLLIAADGSKSRVRDLLAVPFEGLTYPETTILITTAFPFERHLPGLANVNYVWYDGGTFSLLRLPDLWRVSLYPDDGETDAQALEPARLQAKLQRIVPRDEPYEINESRPYRIHQRIVGDYRVGRVLLAGDAAHLNSPSGGMGMNGGIHDAFNLTEKLPGVWRGEQPLDSLDRYTRQRRPIAQEQILRQAHANRTRMQERDPERRRAELRRLQDIAGDAAKVREYLLRSSMIAGLRQAEALP